MHPTEDETDSDSTPRPTRRRSPVSEDDSVDAASDVDGEEDVDTNQEQQVKKMVRLALACEHRRSEIRRADIAEKVLGSTGRRGAFNKVFEKTQEQLQQVFGMEMTELPAKEKVTIAQKRAAQKSSTSSSTKSWIVTSTLPPTFRTADILSAPDSSYVALYTFIVSTILLSGGQLPSSKLERYLRRANADETTPVAATDKLIQRLCKDGYIIRVKDTSSGEEMIDYVVGPRGRVEVGEEGVAGLVKSVYGDTADEELNKRIQRSLALSRREPERVVNGNAREAEKKKGRPKGRRRNEEEAAEVEDDESDEE
ncbi:MAG: Altered inheritance of mitochondria protein 18 mitochondrial [Bathelium mastoideum]|nr:MAG: Altered inheritance of mitochondria protein 18 mitochondrial [Bathelium mastoideum]